MPITTAVPAPQFTDHGFVSPSQGAILLAVQAEINAAFRGGLNPALETPQGQLASSETAVIGNTYDLFCALANGVDPAFATGRMQDAIGRIYFIARNNAAPTVVDCLCTGVVGLKIPAGSIALAEDGNLYTSLDDGVISAGGNVTISFACNASGPIACPEGTLNQIYRAIPGWDSITNEADGVIGRNAESRREFEDRRAQSTAVNSTGAVVSIRGSVMAVEGVLDAYVTENATNAPLVIGAVTLIANSLYVAAVGGTNSDVAEAIWRKKAPGCSYNGGTTVTVFDKSYDPPYPSYDVKFQRPASLPIIFAVDLQDSDQVPSDADVQIQNAIIAAFAGADGGPRARIGGTIFATRFNAPIAALGAWAQIISLQIGSSNTAIAKITASIAGTTLTVTAFTLGAGLLAIGQTVIGNGVEDGTTITGQLSGGAGNTGTYSLSGGAQTVSSEAMTAVLPDQNKVSVEINQAPTISAANIAVTLTP